MFVLDMYTTIKYQIIWVLVLLMLRRTFIKIVESPTLLLTFSAEVGLCNFRWCTVLKQAPTPYFQYEYSLWKPRIRYTNMVFLDNNTVVIDNHVSSYHRPSQNAIEVSQRVEHLLCNARIQLYIITSLIYKPNRLLIVLVAAFMFLFKASGVCYCSVKVSVYANNMLKKHILESVVTNDQKRGSPKLLIIA